MARAADNGEVDEAVNVNVDVDVETRFAIESCRDDARRGIFQRPPFVAVSGLKSLALPGG